jgi:hypothetical protein
MNLLLTVCNGIISRPLCPAGLLISVNDKASAACVCHGSVHWLRGLRHLLRRVDVLEAKHHLPQL